MAPPHSVVALYTPTVSGSARIHASYDGLPLGDSPFPFIILDAEASSSWADGPGLVSAQAGEPSSFTVHLRTRNRLPVTHSDGSTVLKVDFTLGSDRPFDASQSLKLGELQALDKGDWGLTYVVTQGTECLVSFLLRGEHIRGSPYRVPIKFGPLDPSCCLVSGEGAFCAIVGAPASFRIESADRYKNLLRQGGYTFQAVVETESGMRSNAHVSDELDGSYVVTYTPQKRGDCRVFVTYGTVPLCGSPFSVKVLGADSTQSTVEAGNLSGDIEAGKRVSIVVTTRTFDGRTVALEAPRDELLVCACVLAA